MHAALGVREEWAFEMDADRLRFAVVWIGFDGIGERGKGAQRGVDGGGCSGGQIVRDAVPREEALHLAELCGRGAHYVVAHRAVGVNVQEGGGERVFFVRERFGIGVDGSDGSVRGQGEDGVVDGGGAGEQAAGCDGGRRHGAKVWVRCQSVRPRPVAEAREFRAPQRRRGRTRGRRTTRAVGHGLCRCVRARGRR